VTWFAILAALTVVLRVAGWNNWSLWLDEAIQVDFASRPFTQMWKAIVQDGVHPPLDYIVTFVTLRLGSSDAVLRVPPVIWSVLTLPAIWIRFGPRKWLQAAGAGAVFATLPFAIHYGQEVRPYALCLFLVAAADAARHHAVLREGLWLRVTCAVLSVLAVYTHYLAVVFLAAMFLVEAFAAFQSRRESPDRFKAALVLPILTGLFFAPWLGVVRNGMTRSRGEGVRSTISTETVRSYVVGFATGVKPAKEAPIAAGVLWTLAGIGCICASGEERLRLILEFLASFIGVLCVLSWTGHWWDLRYTFFAVLPFCRAIGETAAWALPRIRLPRTITLAAFCLGLLALQSKAIQANVKEARPDWRKPHLFLVEQNLTGKSGPVLCADPWSYYCLRGQTLRKRPPIDVLGPISRLDELTEAMRRHGSGWVLRSSIWRNSGDTEQLLMESAPAATFAEVDGTSIFRFEGGQPLTAGAAGKPALPQEGSAEALRPLSLNFECWIPVIVHAKSARGGTWRSDLTFFNPGAGAVSVRLAAGERATSFEIARASQAVVTDAVWLLLSRDGAWPLSVKASSAVQVQATNNAIEESGTHGASLPCLPLERSLRQGESVFLSGLRQDSEFRTNIGLSNTGTETAEVEIELFSANGTRLHSYRQTVDPLSWVQTVEPLAKGPAGAARDGYARVSIRAGHGVFAVSSVIDNRTNDATLEVAKR
jgi:hypothetical protein